MSKDGTNMQPQKMTPEEYERLYLPKLNKAYEQSTEWLRSNNISVTKNVTSTYIATVIEQLQEHEKYFLAYEYLAQYLNNAGLPQMSKRLADILADIRSAIQSYRQLYQNSLAMENWRPPMPPFFW